MELPKHLGGHRGINNDDAGALKYIVDRFHIRSMVDVGCGTGRMVEMAAELGVKAIGVDGDWTVNRKVPVIIHDYTTGPVILPDPWYNLAYSVEFVEHVDEKYLPNFMDTFKKCDFVMITHAVPGQKGYHHVNCQAEDYWIKKFSECDFMFDRATTDCMRAASTMTQGYMQKTGLFFIARGPE